MALIICPECRSEVSDRAITCPHCGYPLQMPQKENTSLPEHIIQGSKVNVLGVLLKIIDKKINDQYPEILEKFLSMTEQAEEPNKAADVFLKNSFPLYEKYLAKEDFVGLSQNPDEDYEQAMLFIDNERQMHKKIIGRLQKRPYTREFGGITLFMIIKKNNLDVNAIECFADSTFDEWRVLSLPGVRKITEDHLYDFFGDDVSADYKDLQQYHIPYCKELSQRLSTNNQTKIQKDNKDKKEEVLRYIAQHGPATMVDIASFLGETLHTVRAVLEKLEKQHLIIKDIICSQTYYSIVDKEKPRNPIIIRRDDPRATKYDAALENMTAAINVKDSVLGKSKSFMLPHEYTYFKDCYKYFEEAYSNYHLAALNHVGSLLSQRDALKAKKVDPAFAGGLAEGVAGVGAGAYTALKQYQRNQSIDEAKVSANTQVQNTGISESLAKKNAEDNYFNVMAFINTYPELETLFLEAKKDIADKNNSSQKSGGCYVATAVYGSYDCPQVWTLRRYRDYTLAETWYGRAFIRLYYASSPTLVKWFGKTQWFKNLWKPKLDKLVAVLNIKGVLDTPYQDRCW